VGPVIVAPVLPVFGFVEDLGAVGVVLAGVVVTGVVFVGVVVTGVVLVGVVLVGVVLVDFVPVTVFEEPEEAAVVPEEGAVSSRNASGSAP
jgi:hypothetical protein